MSKVNLLPSIEKLRLLTCKVMPQIYSDSLSYYEDLGLIMAKVNEIIEHYDPEAIIPAIGDFVEQWLAEHPEATTTVQDGSITAAKLANGAVTWDKLSKGNQHRIEAVENIATSLNLAFRDLETEMASFKVTIADMVVQHKQEYDHKLDEQKTAFQSFQQSVNLAIQSLRTTVNSMSEQIANATRLAQEANAKAIASSSVSSSGLVSLKNASGGTVTSFQLPLYDGEVV